MKLVGFLLLCALVKGSAVYGQNLPEDVAMKSFMAKRFGMFIHFGPVTLRGTEIGWSRGHEVPTSEYDNLYKEFNPALFNADAWVKAAKDAGVQYLVITAKHHDGFCLWPTAVSPYNISNSPFKRDIVGELADACKRQGITFCVYFTVLDWHDPDYPGSRPYDSTLTKTGNINRFKATMKSELNEIVTKYHPFMLWFDGNWEQYWSLEDGKEIYSYLKGLDPALLVNNRIGKGDHTKRDSLTVGDFITPEQVVGAFNMADPWESCITICNQWAWKPNDHMKSLKQCVQTLEKTAGGNGNLLLNVGPMMDGRIEARQVSRLAEMGDWLKQYGESIYGTMGGPYFPTDDFVTTRKGNKIYIHLFASKDSVLRLAPIPGALVKRVQIMNGADLSFTQDAAGYVIHVPEIAPGTISTLIVLEMNKPTENLATVAAQMKGGGK